MKRQVVFFQSDSFERADSDESDPWGKDVAVFLVKELSRRGAAFDSDEVVEGVNGWRLFPSIGKDHFDLFVHGFHWKNKDYWVVRLGKKSGCIASLLGGKQREEATIPLHSLVSAILEGQKGITDVTWISEDEFDRLNVRGITPEGLGE